MRSKTFLTVAVLILGLTPAFAGPIRNLIAARQEARQGSCVSGCSVQTSQSFASAQTSQTTATSYASTTTATASVATAYASTGVAQQKAEIQARSGRCFHPGGAMQGSHEGCGFSSVSADDAIRHCCYWGRLNPIDIGVARGHDGWYACVQYGSGPLRTFVGGLANTVGDTLQSTGQVFQNVGNRVTNGPTCTTGNCGGGVQYYYVR